MATELESRMLADLQNAMAVIDRLRKENEDLHSELKRLGEEIQSYARIERLLRSAEAEELVRSRRAERPQQASAGSKRKPDAPLQGASRRQRGASGRPNLPADIWAWLQVNQHQRPMNEVYKEWLERPDVRARDQRDPKRQFNRITKPEWGE